MIIIINGPSGSGKTTLGNYFKDFGFKEIISTTTRKIRPGEIDGIHYYFVDKDDFLKMDMIEESVYSDNYYGVSKKEVEEKTKDGHAFASLDINGVKAFKELFKEGVKVIYIKVSKSKLEKRMVKRGDSWENVIKRLKNYSKTGEGNNGSYADYIIDNNGSLEELKRKAIKILKELKII